MKARFISVNSRTHIKRGSAIVTPICSGDRKGLGVDKRGKDISHTISSSCSAVAGSHIIKVVEFVGSF